MLRASYALVQATVGVGTIIIPYIGVAYTRGGGYLPNPPTVVSTSSSLASQLVFMYDVDEAVVKAMQRGGMHEWTHIQFKAICRRHGLSVKGVKGELMQCVHSHFHQMYQF